MGKIKAIQVKSKQCEEWIQSKKAVLRNDLRPPDMEGFLDYYLLNNGGLLLRTVFEKRNGILYETYDEYLRLKAKSDRREDLATKYKPQKNASFDSYLRISVQDFKNLLPQSSMLLEEAFSIKANSLDYSIKSLEHVSKAMKKILEVMDGLEFEEKYIFLITAYSGEVIRKHIDGEWIINGNEEGLLHQVLVIEKGKPEYSYKPEIPLIKILAGDVPNRLDVEVGAQLYKYGFIKGNNNQWRI